MAMNIEKLLRLTADYHNFCSDDHLNAAQDPDELSLEELDFVAAAAAVPQKPKDEDQNRPRPVR